MTLHVVALPHTATTKDYLPCAYTQKVLNFCRMMTGLGYQVIHYGTEGSTVPCEHVTLITAGEQEALFGAYDWRSEGFKLSWDANQPYWRLHNYRAVEALRPRLQPGDALCLIGGACQKPIADAYPGSMAVEWGIGYAGVFAPFRVWESYAWQHCVLGSLHGAYAADGRFYDCVIPNSFPAEDFPAGRGDGGYVVYIGRLIRRKGVTVAAEAARAAGVLLRIAGQGGTVKDGRLWFDGTSLPLDGIEYCGTVGVERRAALVGGALACLVPTQYVEPFGGVAVEAQLYGTPAITTDWGAFTETVPNGLAGYRCHTLGEFVWAIRQAASLDRDAIRARAMALYTLDAVAPMYDRYFRRLADLAGQGWYTIRETCEV